MTCATKTVKFQGSFSVQNAAGVNSPNKPIRDLDLVVDQVQASDPIDIPGSTTDYAIPFGQITVGRRIYLETDQEVTVKFNQNTDVGFPWLGVGVVPSGPTGITALYITTGPTDTCVHAVVTG